MLPSPSSSYPSYPPAQFDPHFSSLERLKSSASSHHLLASTMDPFPPLHLAWSGLTVTKPGRDEPILDSLTGRARSGELLAVMGPSGAGKSTFLDALCRRTRSQGDISINGSSSFLTSDYFSFVEQDDALLGVLTVRETVTFAAKLALGSSYPHLATHVFSTLASLGLQDIASQRLGTPIQRGVSGGQKRRVTIACSVVAKPRILVLDEPTSGLDARSAKEVVAFLRRLAREQNVLIICTIHQPNFETFALFDRLLLLAGGKTMYDGPTAELDTYLSSIDSPTPAHVNPADHALDLVSTDFLTASSAIAPTITPAEHITHLASQWSAYSAQQYGADFGRRETKTTALDIEEDGSGRRTRRSLVAVLARTAVLMHRNSLNYSRNLLAYGIRLGMYIGMALLLALVWIRLGWSGDKLNDRLSVHFFSVAFLGFMSVAGIPAFLEERSVFVRERANGLYSPAEYLLAQTIVSVPFLFTCSVVYSLIIYWSIGLHPGAAHFFRFLIYLFLALFCAESQSLLIAAAVPIFVAALALASFANGLWMCVQGYFIRATSLPKFWYYTFHFIDYQTFSFELLVRNDFLGRTLDCPVLADGACNCPIPSSLYTGAAETCAISGEDVMQNLDIAGVSDGLYVGILLIIAVVFRLLMWGVLVWRKK
ncbi:hypothetical protein JCM8547_007591 [Rhodosporidiobolus lusitaniae]